MGTRETDQPPLWIATSDLPTSPGHPFYARLTTLLDGHHVDRFVEGLCDRFYAPVMGRPSLAPGRYFRLRLVGSFEGIDSERGMAWRATDSLAVRSFLRVAVDEAPPDHSTIARTRRLIDLETHRTVFTWVQQRLVEAGRLTGKTIAIDATTLEATAAMRSIVRRDTGESDQAFLAGLATASGVETPTREGLARLDRKRKKKTSNTDWTHPHDPDATVTKMKDGRTHLAHKAEQAVDMETGAIVAVTRQGADVGDTTTIIETAIAATEQVEDAQANVDDRQSLEEIVGDKGYHSNQTLIDLDAGGIRSYVSEPDRGRRDWSKDPEARAPVYGNRRRMRGRRGRRLMRQRGERIERSFAHLYDTGGMRRTHLRGHTNILKRLLIHAGGFNLGLVMRHLIGIGPPRGLQGRVAAVLATLGGLMGVVRRRLTTISSSHRLIPAVRGRLASLATFAVNSSAAITCTTGCWTTEWEYQNPHRDLCLHLSSGSLLRATNSACVRLALTGLYRAVQLLELAERPLRLDHAGAFLFVLQPHRHQRARTALPVLNRQVAELDAPAPPRQSDQPHHITATPLDGLNFSLLVPAQVRTRTPVAVV